MRVIARFFRMKGILDDHYTMYENGDVLHEFDASIYPGNQDLKRTINAKDLNSEIKEKLLENASEADKELAKNLLGL